MVGKDSGREKQKKKNFKWENVWKKENSKIKKIFQKKKKKMNRGKKNETRTRRDRNKFVRCTE